MVSAKDTAPAPTGKTAEGGNTSLPSETISAKIIRAETPKKTEAETYVEQRQRQKDINELLRLCNNKQEIEGERRNISTETDKIIFSSNLPHCLAACAQAHLCASV